MSQPTLISLVIRARNAAGDLERCLVNVAEQFIPNGCEIEIVVVDNESTDSTREVAERFGCSIVTISSSDFSWGRALNLGIKHCSGDIVLILSADAYPADRNWLKEMISPFMNLSVAGVYGRQIPRCNAPIDEVVRLKKTFGINSITAQSLPPNFTAKGGNFPVSNACAAIRKTVWEKEQYDEEIAGAEDVLWTYNVFIIGYTISYQASARVYHSHNDPLFRNAWRSLEILKKNKDLSDQRVTLYDYAKYIVSFTKRRIINTFYRDIPLPVRLHGLLMLPIELIAFLITTPFFHIEKKSSKFRPIFWGK